jgi:hypothetical protein
MMKIHLRGKELVHLIFIIPKKKKKLRHDAKAHDFNYFFVFFIPDKVRWVSFERTILLHTQ